MLILDEAHKLRNLYGVEKTPQVAKRFRHALEMRRFRYVLMLTATPIQNRLWDLYSLVDLLTSLEGMKIHSGVRASLRVASLPTGERRRANSRPKHGINSARLFTAICPVFAEAMLSSTFRTASCRCIGLIRRLPSWS